MGSGDGGWLGLLGLVPVLRGGAGVMLGPFGSPGGLVVSGGVVVWPGGVVSPGTVWPGGMVGSCGPVDSAGGAGCGSVGSAGGVISLLAGVVVSPVSEPPQATNTTERRRSVSANAFFILTG